MKCAARETIHVHLRFSKRSLAQPALDELSGNPELTVTLLRGRIAPRAASCRVAARALEAELPVESDGKRGATFALLFAAAA